MSPRKNSLTAKKEIYNRLKGDGIRQLNPGEGKQDEMDTLVEEFRARREGGEKLSIRQYCGEKKISQKKFEGKLQGSQETKVKEQDPRVIEYYSRTEVQEVLYLWAQKRRLALHFRQGVIGLGFRKSSDVSALAAAASTAYPTFHTSVGKYEGTSLTSFDLVAEVDFKGDWETCFKVTRPLVMSLKSSGINFLVKFSGHSSAHVVVPCSGSNYRKAAETFIQRLPSGLRGSGKLDLSFRYPQHFLRMPYAIHEKTGLVSLPLTPEEFDNFNPEMARPEVVKVDVERIKKVLASDNSSWLLGE